MVSHLGLGERNCIPNYKSVSLYTSLSTVFEKVMYNIILRHLNDNILVEKQFGFRKKYDSHKSNL